MVLEKLSESLKGTLQKIAKSLFVDEKLINELVKDIQRALLQADVNVKLVFELTQRIKDRILKEETPGALTKKEHLINIVYEELTKFLGGEKSELKLGDKLPNKIMLIGLFGSGKTTTAGKLAKHFMKRGKKVALLGLDVHRPAATDQLMQVGKAINAPVFIIKGEKDPIKIYKHFEPEYKKYDLLIIDTAGRDALSQDLIEELKKVHDTAKPDESLLVISADIGQAAQSQAKAFHEAGAITGVIVTKMDGTAKGGGALSACAVTGAPIKFIGVGEKVDDFEQFNPKGFVGRLLGMGDLEALLEKAKEAITEEEAKDIEKKLLKGEFNLIDLYNQMEAMSKMGPLGKILEMVPGFGQISLPKEALQVQEGKLKKWKHAMNSMTKKELEEPDIIDAQRIERIAKGSGVSTSEIRDMVKQYKQSKKLVKMLKGESPEKLMKKIGKKAGPQLKF
ncbi:signal recognition particle protein Srp54 [Candidatus Woesearchaeota archaeon]|nr:signal recognition particle protein Srp54 [Candidatus Woesearchaeota archaeon]MBW3016333.1 signal recognition particle protein Srp54 [Candidatus Woesearchaeota archaeon]